MNLNIFITLTGSDFVWGPSKSGLKCEGKCSLWSFVSVGLEILKQFKDFKICVLCTVVSGITNSLISSLYNPLDCQKCFHTECYEAFKRYSKNASTMSSISSNRLNSRLHRISGDSSEGEFRPPDLSVVDNCSFYSSISTPQSSEFMVRRIRCLWHGLASLSASYAQHVLRRHMKENLIQITALAVLAC